MRKNLSIQMQPTHSSSFWGLSEHLLHQCKQLSGGFPHTRITARNCSQGPTQKYTQSKSPDGLRRKCSSTQPHRKSSFHPFLPMCQPLQLKCDPAADRRRNTVFITPRAKSDTETQSESPDRNVWSLWFLPSVKITFRNQ